MGRRRLLRNASIALAAWLTLWGANRLAEAQQTSIVSGGGSGTIGGGAGGGTSLFGQAGSAGADLANAFGTTGTGYSGGQGGFTGNTAATTTGRAAGGGAVIPAASNPFGPNYVNPLSLGLMVNGATGKATFNQPTYATTTTTSNIRGGTRTGTRTATTSSLVAFTTYGMNRAIPYRTELSSDVPIIAPVASALQAELRDVVKGSTRLTNKDNIDVSVANGIVFLRGQVATAEERRLVEAMIRLTPGARRVSNELTVAGAAKQ
ncbi:MAG: BON domain-containing protein [Gemmataceae bacterium]|nr:BON domain-containing protein [Gemmataceae bacterium]